MTGRARSLGMSAGKVESMLRVVETAADLRRGPGFRRVAETALLLEITVGIRRGGAAKGQTFPQGGNREAKEEEEKEDPRPNESGTALEESV